MRISIEKSTSKVIEMQSNATAGTLIKNAVSAGYHANDVEERVITQAQWESDYLPNIPVPQKFNLIRFMGSLSADVTLRALMKDPYYGALSDCLRNEAWDVLKGIAALMIADNDSAGTVELFTAFKTKLLTEEGVDI